MNKSIKFVIFEINGWQLALHLSRVERVVSVVEITPLPKAPVIVLGLINIEGKIIPVIDIRKIFHLKKHAVDLSNQLIITNISKWTIALLADTVTGVKEFSKPEVVAPKEIISRMNYIESVIKLKDGMILIPDLDKLLSDKEIKILDKIIKKKKEKEKIGNKKRQRDK